MGIEGGCLNAMDVYYCYLLTGCRSVEVSRYFTEEMFSVYHFLWDLSFTAILVDTTLKRRDDCVKVGFKKERN